jgi:phosphoribosylformylglycinamidine cyclo-ligase
VSLHHALLRRAGSLAARTRGLLSRSAGRTHPAATEAGLRPPLTRGAPLQRPRPGTLSISIPPGDGRKSMGHGTHQPTDDWTSEVESRRYAELGVSSLKDDVRRATEALPPGLFPGAFCRVMPDLVSGSPDHCVISHADGAGTKSILAYIHWALHGDPRVFRGIAQDAIVMNLDDMLCAGATTNFVVTSIINRNAKRIDGTVLRAIVDGTTEFVSRMNSLGVSMLYAGGETADLGDIVRTLTVDTALTSRVPQSEVVANNIRAGQAIIGLESGGSPASYESEWNSGIGSNGLTFARHLLLRSPLGATGTTVLADDAIADSLVYMGTLAPDAKLPGTAVTALEALLSPTRTFAPIMKAVLAEHRSRISGIVHNSGGGQLKCLKSGNGISYQKDIGNVSSALFQELRNISDLSWGELAKVFNLGYRMEIVCDVDIVDDIVSIAAEFNVGARQIGETTDSPLKQNLLNLRVEGEKYAFAQSY